MASDLSRCSDKNLSRSAMILLHKQFLLHNSPLIFGKKFHIGLPNHYDSNFACVVSLDCYSSSEVAKDGQIS